MIHTPTFKNLAGETITTLIDLDRIEAIDYSDQSPIINVYLFRRSAPLVIFGEIQRLVEAWEKVRSEA